jgi:Ca2+-binding EF-hand superfamily protein
VVLTVRLGKRAAREPVVEVNRQSKRAQARATTAGAILKLDGARFELNFQDEMGPGVGLNVQQQFVGQFKAADKKGKGYLERREAEQSRALRPLFGAMDRDGDGKLTEKELLAYLAEMAKVRALARKGCLALLLQDQGKGFFDALDANGDGRLSVRELRRAPEALARLDADGDGTVAPAELPRRYRGTFEGGQAPLGSGDMIAFYALPTADAGLAPLPGAARGPLWFRKMDRNRDGDVSRKEWLGADEEFNKADADGDGLISLEEAERYGRMKRKE